MKAPLSWLKKYVPVSVPVEEVARRLTMAGVEVSAIHRIGGDWDPSKVLVGYVVRVDRHPNADRLTLPTVELGNGETQTVVCGAPNVAAGQKIAFAREGAMLFSTRSGRVEPLKASKIRGVESAGMVCSVLELGLGEDHEGILVLSDDAPLGLPLIDYLGDAVLEVDVTPNRPDCLSILGVAHEVAALTGESVTEPSPDYPEQGDPIEGRVTVEIADPSLCRRYTASLIAGVKVGPSPQWMQDALTKAGLRPINNVVDVTNYVMLEYNQPLHAFDFDAVKEREIVVRQARAGERLVTLDGTARTLDPPMLVIADAQDAVGLAGVMGGAGSEVTEATTAILLESANFDPVNTRRTASALRIASEAAYRFERGIRAELAPLGLRRATQLILELTGGEAAEGIVDAYPGRTDRPPVRLSRRRLKQVLGADIEMSRAEQILASLGFERDREPEGLVDLIETVEAGPAPERTDTLWVRAPYWRSDVSMEDDLVEEVARMVGYDNLPSTMMSTPTPRHERQALREVKERVRDMLAASGMHEVISYSLTSLDALRKVEALNDGVEPLMIANPMSSQLAYLRTSLRGGILDTLARNVRSPRDGAVRIFEIGRTYHRAAESDGASLPSEKEVLTGVLSGRRFPVSWLADGDDMGFFDAKGLVEMVLDGLGVQASYEPVDDPILHPGKAARVLSGGDVVGVVGEVHPRILERFDLDDRRAAIFELDIESLGLRVPAAGARYKGGSRFPEAERDLALIVDADAPAARIRGVIERHKLVVRSEIFDVFSGGELPAGKRSLAFRVVIQSDKGTLTTDQVNRVVGDILRQLGREFGAELRTQESGAQ